MIEAVWMIARLAGGLASVFLAGYALFVLVTPGRAAFSPGERFSLAYGLGSLGLTLWMLALTFFQVPYSLGTIAAPWLAVVLAGAGPAWRRGWPREDGRAILRCGRGLVTLGCSLNFSRLERMFLLLLLAAFGFGLLRAALYPVWAWDAVATWGLKAKAFYLGRGLDFSRFEAHNYYPNLIPLLMSYLYFWLGGVQDSLVKAIFPLWGGAVAVLFYSLLRRLQVGRTEALGATTYLVLNGVTFLVHLFIAYADLALTFYQLAAAGLIYLWLRDEAPAGSGPLLVCCCGGLAWSKYEGWPLVLITFLAAGLTLVWLRPPRFWKRLLSLMVLGVGAWSFTLPWRFYVSLQGMQAGGDHIGGFYLHQLTAGAWQVLQALFWPPYFGLLWPAIFLSLILAGRDLWRTALIFLGLFIMGNLAALCLAYALVPASPAEFPLYVRATVDRLLLHVAPASALIFSAPLASRTTSPRWCGNFI